MKKQILILCSIFFVTSLVMMAQLNPYTEAYQVDKEDMQMMKDIISKKPGKLVLPNPAQGAQWFPRAGLGLFMHWGIHSAIGAQPSWDMVPMEASWGGNIFPPEKYYEASMDKFNPKSYNPEIFLQAAKDAGFTYAVLTTKHCDGYAIWPSKYGLSTKMNMGGRDLLKPYVEACRKVGMKVGFYYTPWDWHYPGNPAAPVRLKGIAVPDTNPANVQKNYEKYLAFTLRQLKELLTQYGKIDVLWFDSMSWTGQTDFYNQQVYAWIRSLQPDIVINDRWHAAINPDNPKETLAFGDFQTPFECRLPDYKLNGWWENCDIWTVPSDHSDAGWGYEIDGKFHDWSWFFNRLATARSMGGNLLLNVGPNPDGDMHPNFYKHTWKLKKWMDICKESVIGVDPSPGREWSNVLITTRPGVWYLHVLPEFKATVMVKLPVFPQSVTLMQSEKTISYSYQDGILAITIPKELRTEMDDVIKIVL